MAAEVGKSHVTEHQEEEGERQRAVRLRRNEETRAELESLRKMEKVKGSLKTNSVNQLQRAQLQKMKGIVPPLVVKIKRRSSFKGKTRQRREEKEGKKSRRKSWVVGEFGGEGVKDRRKGDKEELKDLRSMEVVKKRLTEREKVHEQAVKFFKHRYVLDPESTQKSNTILVTGYEPLADERSAVELIRQQSSIVISNILDQPTHPVVLSRLTELEKENLERVVVGAKGGRGGEFPTEGRGVRGESGGTTGTKKVQFLRGSSFEGIVEENGHHDDDDHEIIKAKHVRTKSAPHMTMSLAPPTSELLDKTPAPMMMEAASVTPPDSPQVSGMENGNETVPSPPPVLVRTSSYTSAMETDEVEEVSDAVSPAKSDAISSVAKSRPKPWKRRSPQSLRRSPQSPAKKSPRKEKRFFFKMGKKERQRMEEEEKIGSYLALSYDADSVEGVELMGSHDNISIESFPIGRSDRNREEERGSPSPAESQKAKLPSLSQRVPPTPEPLQPFKPSKPLQSLDPSKPLQPLDPSKSPRPLDPSKPLQPLDPSKSPRPLDPSKPPRPLDPSKPPRPLDPSKPPRPLDPLKRRLDRSQTTDPPGPLTHHKLTPQFSITSLPGLNPAPQKYYTPISPRVDKVTGTYAGDTNPFAEDFDRSLREKSASAAARGPAPPVTRSNTQLPDDIMSNEGFLNFLEMHGAKPSTSMYITYQIQLVSEQIDSKYGKQLNQALDSIIPEIIADNISWENFSAVCRSLLFKGGLNDGLFIVPAFAKRLLGFLPEMRDTITYYTQQVVEEYAMDWLLMRGGWGELLRHRDEEERREEKEREEEEEAWPSDLMWAWPAEEWEESNGDQEEVEDSFHTAMGYGLVTPGPESEGRSLASSDIALCDIGDVVDKQVGDHDDGPHPQNPPVVMTMGSELFLGPVQEITPPIGRGLRRVISVEVLFTTSGSSGGVETDFSLRRASLSRVSSLPSICSSILSPSSPISIPSPRKRLSTDHSSGSPSSPAIFTLPSMRRRPHPLDSTSSSSDYRRQSSASVESTSIRLVGGAMSPTPSSPLVSRAKLGNKSSTLVSTVTKDESGTTQATPTPNKDTQPSTPSEAPPTVQHDGIYDNHQTTPTNNEPNRISVQRSVTSSSEGSYANYGLESDHGHMTEWEWKWIATSAFLLTAAAGITVAFWVSRKK